MFHNIYGFMRGRDRKESNEYISMYMQMQLCVSSSWSGVLMLVWSIIDISTFDDRFIVIRHSSPCKCCPWQPWGGQMNELQRTALESFIIEINPSAHGKWEDNIIITPQVSRFYFSICLLSFRQAEAIWHIVYVYVFAGMCWWVRACEREQVQLRKSH